MPKPERQQNVLDLLKGLRGIEALKRLFWSELNYQRVNQPLSRRGWAESAGKALADDPVLFASGGEDNAFHVIYCRLASDALARGFERPVVTQLLREHPYALFVFSNNGQNDWHFLNVKYDDQMERRRLFRRITVRPGAGLRTATERVQLLDLAEINPELSGITPLAIQQRCDVAFDVETVTKDFFREIANWYFWALKNVRFPKDAPKEADGHDHISVIRLITRLIFCWFVKEKGLIPDTLFDERKLAQTLTGFEPAKTIDNESAFYKQEVALDPELSGKVFENLLAAYNPETGATARKQTGSFYTPREIVNDMVDEALIACLKEKLTAKIAKNTKTEENQAEASSSALSAFSAVEQKLRHLFAYDDEPHKFTTPEVDALIAAIDSLKSLDPAVGSGAFPMGILHKLVFILGKLDPRNEKWKERQIARVRDTMATAEKIEDATARERAVRELEQQITGINEAFEHNELDYGRKLYLIENCIYGVDIQPIAVQIAKMRFFISLIVDQKIDDTQPNRGVRPLPNLETKFVAANTLIAVNRPGQQLLRNRDIDAKEVELRRVRERHFIARTPKQKAKCRDDDARLRAEIAELLKGDGWDSATPRKLASWNPYDQNVSANFFDAEWMFGVCNEFDLGIGDPPYGAKFTDEEKQLFLRIYRHQDYQLDSYLLFLERGFDFLRQSGVLTFIIPNPWLSNLKLKRIRKFVFGSQTIQEIVHYSRKVFDAVVDTEVVILRKQSPSGTTTTIKVVAELDSVFSRRVAQAKWAALNGEPVNIFADPAQESIVAKLQRDSFLLKDFCNVTVGMKPYQVGKGVPRQTRDIVEKRIFDATHRKDKSYRPLLRGRDIEKYVTKWEGNRWIKYGDHLAEPRPSGGFDASKKIVIRQTGDSLVATLDREQSA